MYNKGKKCGLQAVYLSWSNHNQPEKQSDIALQPPCVPTIAFVYAEDIRKTETIVTCDYLDGKLDVVHKPTTVGFALTSPFECYIGTNKIMNMTNIAHQIRNTPHVLSIIS